MTVMWLIGLGVPIALLLSSEVARRKKCPRAATILEAVAYLWPT